VFVKSGQSVSLLNCSTKCLEKGAIIFSDSKRETEKTLINLRSLQNIHPIFPFFPHFSFCKSEEVSSPFYEKNVKTFGRKGIM
jgi:hypothetical protein